MPEWTGGLLKRRSPLHSLKIRLLGLWALSLVASVAVGILLIQLYRQSTAAQVGHADAVIAQACDMIQERFGFYIAGWSNPAPKQFDERLRSDLNAVVAVALAHKDGVEGGIWQTNFGSLAYAYPTYQGSGPKTDLPAAERDEIRAANLRTARDEQPFDRQTTSRTQTLLLHACPLNGPISGLDRLDHDAGPVSAGPAPVAVRLRHPARTHGLDVRMARSHAVRLGSPCAKY